MPKTKWVSPDAALTETEARAELTRAREKIYELEADRDALCHQLNGEREKAYWWLTSKVVRQSKANDAMHSVIVRQRFILRTLETLGRGLTREEWAHARSQVREQEAQRVGDPA